MPSCMYCRLHDFCRRFPYFYTWKGGSWVMTPVYQSLPLHRLYYKAIKKGIYPSWISLSWIVPGYIREPAVLFIGSRCSVWPHPLTQDNPTYITTCTKPLPLLLPPVWTPVLPAATPDPPGQAFVPPYWTPCLTSSTPFPSSCSSSLHSLWLSSVSIPPEDSWPPPSRVMPFPLVSPTIHQEYLWRAPIHNRNFWSTPHHLISSPSIPLAASPYPLDELLGLCFYHLLLI